MLTYTQTTNWGYPNPSKDVKDELRHRSYARENYNLSPSKNNTADSKGCLEVEFQN